MGKCLAYIFYTDVERLVYMVYRSNFFEAAEVARKCASMNSVPATIKAAAKLGWAYPALENTWDTGVHGVRGGILKQVEA